MFQISEVQESPAFNGRRSFLTLRGIRSDQAKRLKALERENTRLKKLVAEAELDKAILREAASGNF